MVPIVSEFLLSRENLLLATKPIGGPSARRLDSPKKAKCLFWENPVFDDIIKNSWKGFLARLRSNVQVLTLRLTPQGYSSRCSVENLEE